ncbi:MAG: RNA 2'-phosphotransferase [Luteolibacter sp.]|uniref:RNA 2'-phosphotransferase n=1 Tax=Luteolibacter sp. TaxID=1962973 RepID=UPI00326664FF
MHCGLPKWEEPPEKTEIYPIPRKSAPRPDPAIAESARLKNFLTLVLRDDPRAIGLKLDSEGWTAVDQLFTRAGKYGVKFTPNALEKLMGEDGNPGFEWNRATQRIRAIQI